MQAADSGEADDVGANGTVLDRPTERRVLAEAEMGPVLVVVVDEGVEQAAEMVRVGFTCIDRSVAVTPFVKVAPRSKIMKRGADSNGKASRSCCATQVAVGLVVTAQRTTSRRP